MIETCNGCMSPTICDHKGRCQRNMPLQQGTGKWVGREDLFPGGFTEANDDVRKATPVDAIFRFWPDAMVELAQHIWDGNKKYNPDHPVISWRRELSSDHVGSLVRHIGIDYVKAVTVEAKIKVMRAVAWRALAQLQLLCEQRDG